MSDQNSSFEQIQEHRAKIDELDRQIVALLNKRAGHSLVIRGLKPGAHLGLYDPKREIYGTILKVMKETPSA